MEEIILAFGSWVKSLVMMLDGVIIFASFSLWDFILGAIVLMLAIGVFWKGADS